MAGNPPGSIHGFVLDGKSHKQRETTAQTPAVPAVSGEDSSVDLMRILSHYCRMRQMEPCHLLGEVARRPP